jgi:hypothetical protein
MPLRAAKAVGVLRRRAVLALLLLAGGLAAGAVIWQAATRTTSTTNDTIGGGDVFTEAKGADACAALASAFTDYPLVWPGPSVLGYPLVDCAHMMTKTRHDEQGRVSHPGGDAFHFGYGTCVTPPGRESCPLPISIVIDPCALTVDGRIIPKGGPPLRSMTVRGAQADVGDHGISFEQSPQIISIYVELAPYDAAQRANTIANAVLVANALVPANAPASAAAAAMSSDALITATLGATKVACP